MESCTVIERERERESIVASVVVHRDPCNPAEPYLSDHPKNMQIQYATCFGDWWCVLPFDNICFSNLQNHLSYWIKKKLKMFITTNIFLVCRRLWTSLGHVPILVIAIVFFLWLRFYTHSAEPTVQRWLEYIIRFQRRQSFTIPTEKSWKIRAQLVEK